MFFKLASSLAAGIGRNCAETEPTTRRIRVKAPPVTKRTAGRNIISLAVRKSQNPGRVTETKNGCGQVGELIRGEFYAVNERRIALTLNHPAIRLKNRTTSLAKFPLARRRLGMCPSATSRSCQPRDQ